MDPLTITCTVGAIARTVFGISQTLHKFIKDTKGVNQSVKDLAVEISGLSTALRAVQAGLNDPAVSRAEKKAEKTESLELWRSVHGSLLNTRTTVDKLDDALEDIRADRTNFAKQAVRQLRLNLKQEEITGLRAQIRTHNGALQMTLQMINVRATCMTSEVSAELGPKIEDLGRMIDELKSSIESSRKHNDAADVPQLISAKHSQRLAKSAEKILSSASTMYSQSEWGGSVFGEVLDDFSRQRMHEWIPPAPTIEETISDSASASQLSPKGDSVFTDPERLTVSQTEDTDIFSPTAEDDDTGGEFEFEVVERFLHSAVKAFEQNEFQEAAELIEAGHALTENLTFQQKHQLDLRGSQLILAKCSYHCGDLDSAEAHLVTYAEQYPPTPEDSVAIQACQASHLLAQVCLKKGKPAVAYAHCKKALIGRRRILGKEDSSYYESLFLLAEICQTSNSASSTTEAKVYLNMIPASMQKNFTKVGQTSKPKVTTPGAAKDKKPASPAAQEPPVLVVPAATNTKQALRSSVIFDFDSLQPQPEYVSDVSTPVEGMAPHDLERAFSSNNPFRRKSADDRASVQRAQTNAHTASRTQSRTQSPAPGVQRVKSTGAIAESSPVVADASESRTSKDPKATPTKNPDEVDWSLLWRFVTKIDDSLLPVAIKNGSKYITSASLRKASVETLKKVATALSSGSKPTISPLHLAVCINHAQLVEMLVEEREHTVDERCPHHCNSDPAIGKNNTPMHCAAQYGRVELIRLLFEMGADVSLKNDSSYTPLHVAVAFGHIDVVYELFHPRSTPLVSGEETPLHVAAKCNRSAILQVLLEGWANLEVFDAEGRTPLHVAAFYNSFGCMEELLQRGADVESTCGAESHTPLHIASRKGHQMAVQELLVFKAQIDARTARGETALHLSIRNRQAQIFRHLLGHGADVDAQDNEGVTALSKAVNDRQRATVDLLVQRKASLEISEHRTKRRAIHAAVMTGNLDIVRALVQAGANLAAVDSSGQTPYLLARSMNYTEIESLLAPTEHYHDQHNEYEQPGLELAESQPGLEVVMRPALHPAYGGLEVAYQQPDSVVQGAADYGQASQMQSVVSSFSEWPRLHQAAFLGNKDQVMTLIRQGANPTKQNNEGYTARELAAQQGHVAIAALLEGLELRSPTIGKRFSRFFGKESR